MNVLNLDAKIYVAGHRGLVGSAIVRNLEDPACHKKEGRGNYYYITLSKALVSPYSNNKQ